MSANLNILKSFVNEYKETYVVQEVVYEEGLVGDIKKFKQNYLMRNFLPSTQLHSILK